MISNKIHKALVKATKRSTHKRHQTGCVLVGKKGEILSTGCSHSSSYRMNELYSIHAEIHALGQGRHQNLNGAKAYICTMARKSGNFTFSAPCLTCAIALKTAGIDEVVFSVGGMDDWCEHLLEWLIQDANLKVYPRRRN